MLNDFSQVISKLHDVVVGWGWMAWPPSALLEGGAHAVGGMKSELVSAEPIQLHPTTSLLYKKRMTFSHPFIMIY